LLIVLAAVQLAPRIVGDYGFGVALQPLYSLALSRQARDPRLCADWKVDAISRLTAGQRLAVGGILRSVGCVDLAIRVMPEFTTAGNRSDLLAYQWGWTAWLQGDAPGAAALWRQGRGINQRLLFEARQVRAADLSEAQRWYEVAIMAASSPQAQAESITAYTEELRGRMPAQAFRARLAYLEAYFGAETAIGYRLSGQRALWEGSYGAALKAFSQAVALGVADAETWYLLGEAAWKTGDLLAAESAFRSALAAPIQVTGRRPWHLDRLAALLSSQGRLTEALLFQEEAVRLNDYYFYADNLALLYARLGQTAQAQAMCAQAAVSWSAPKVLRCQKP
jgi:tetratricopeptide (TPR) repeat protein